MLLDINSKAISKLIQVVDILKLIILNFQSSVICSTIAIRCSITHVSELLNNVIDKSSVIPLGLDPISTLYIHTCITVAINRGIITADFKAIKSYIIVCNFYKRIGAPFSWTSGIDLGGWNNYGF